MALLSMVSCEDIGAEWSGEPGCLQPEQVTIWGWPGGPGKYGDLGT